MEYYQRIEEKLRQFTIKYYKNELIKGAILFVVFGVLYLLATLFVEYVFWLSPTLRTILFWLFVGVETFLLYQFVLVSLSKLAGLKKGISFKEASRMIGNHFPEVSDKLLNILELKDEENSELVLASIEQKSGQLAPVPFSRAIDFSQNKKYLPLLVLPVLIGIFSWVFGIQNSLQDSLKRVVDYKTAYVPPAPYAFRIQNQQLQTIEGKDYTLKIAVEGDVQPDIVKIFYNNQQYYLQRDQQGFLSHTITNPIDDINFYVASNEVVSQNYELAVIKSPSINNIEMELVYPKYLKRKANQVKSATNLSVPEGTEITWKVQTRNTDQLEFIQGELRNSFQLTKSDVFTLLKKIRRPFEYQITSSNKQLKNYENLSFSVDVIKDEFPKISVESDIDSITRETASFLGQISDDYGLRKLQLVYYDLNAPEEKKSLNLKIDPENIQYFSYAFPGNLKLTEGATYELFFKVFDNDGVNGSKSSKSKVFSYRAKTKEEIEKEILLEQKDAINDLEKSILNQQKQGKELNEIQQELQNKKNLEWKDKKRVDNLLKRQEQYQQMMQRQTDKLKQNLEEKEEKDEVLSEKKEELKKRVEELKKLAKQNRLLEEIKKMADKLNKEDLIKKTKELAQQNRQRERSLERILEMTKRFYVEQKTMQIANKVEKLAEKQQELEKKAALDSIGQKKVNKKFEEIQKDLDDLKKDNEKLKEPMDLPDVEDEKEEVEKSLEETMEEMKKQDSKSTKKSQKKAAAQMKKMSQKMQQAMLDAQGESMEENADDLRRILENLVLFSFEQEDLYEEFADISSAHPNFGKNLKKQNVLKTHFEHIDDSLYVLSMRLPRLSTRIQNDLASAHYNIDQSLENFSQNRMYQGQSNQRYVMTATNNLADYLSNMLDNMKNAMSMKKGKGKKKSNEFSLPDLIEKQKGLSKQMQEGMKNSQQKKSGQKQGQKQGDQKGENNQGKDGMNGKLYEIYKQQNELRRMLENALEDQKGSGGAAGTKAKKVLKSMEQLENELLEKGFNPSTIQKMQLLEYQLLKLDEASLKQNKGRKRKSKTNNQTFGPNQLKVLLKKKLYFNQIEILNKQSLPLQPNYKKKVRAYFSDN
ncbi:MAG: hypothetical protein CMB99_10015 [Flavobacteriaceae bacterium]|nr:hypothetical protein [Flavobacteriaceae bacterium]|tara:strand:- start:334242 stop:337535 length:3294 start_codon:yes stop_codon:yes gene_type:complete